MSEVKKEHNHYYKSVKGLEYVDVYRVLDLFEVTDPCLSHAVKKLLVAGGRGHKDIERDIRDVIASCNRWLEMREEEKQQTPPREAGIKFPDMNSLYFTTRHE